MATVHNPTKYNLRCGPLNRELAPGETTEVTASQAAAISPAIFIVTLDEPTPEPESKPAARAVTKTPRGSKLAEER